MHLLSSLIWERIIYLVLSDDDVKLFALYDVVCMAQWCMYGSTMDSSQARLSSYTTVDF